MSREHFSHTAFFPSPPPHPRPCIYDWQLYRRDTVVLTERSEVCDSLSVRVSVGSHAFSRNARRNTSRVKILQSDWCCRNSCNGEQLAYRQCTRPSPARGLRRRGSARLGIVRKILCSSMRRGFCTLVLLILRAVQACTTSSTLTG